MALLRRQRYRQGASFCGRMSPISVVSALLWAFHCLCFIPFTRSFHPTHNCYNIYQTLHTRNRRNVHLVIVSATKVRKSPTSTNDISTKSKFYLQLPQKVIRIYTDYAKRLWKETNPEARKYVDSHRVAKSILLVQQLLLQSEEHFPALPTISSSRVVTAATSSYAATAIPEPQRQQLLDACEAALQSIGVAATPILEQSSHSPRGQQQSIQQYISSNGKILVNGEVSTTSEIKKLTGDSKSLQQQKQPEIISSQSIKTKQATRSIGFGAAMGLAVTCWVFSGNYLFTGLFTLMTALGQLEYYRMVMNTGIFPARRISVIGACSMFLAALFTPDLHHIVLPLSGVWAMIWFLTMRRTLTPIPEIATTFTGLFYLGYVPSFWVRIRLIGMGQREPTRLAPIVEPMLKFLETQGKTLPGFIPQAIHLPITTGAIFIFWTWLSLAFSDVGAYFVGRSFGKTKLGSVFPAAGATSPNKTIEGVVGGCAISAVLAIVGAWVQRWPNPFLTGGLHGLFLGLLGLLGDLTASMLKRDAGLKDFGDLLPEHGGIMDRVDSFIWTAPYS
jgi:phosphatidate cytidylyltransferase